MQIVVNTRLLLKNKLEGIGWFSYQVLKRITTQNNGVHFVFLFDRPFDDDFIFGDNVTPIVLSPQARHPLLYYTWLQGSVKNIVNNLKPDLFFSPDGFLPLGVNCRQLPVIHDINFKHHPHDSRWLTAKYYNHFFPRFAKAATRIATVSEFSKNDIASSYGIQPDTIDVVYNGINPFFRPLNTEEKNSTRSKYSEGKNYFVSVGALHPRKNLPRLIDAFANFKKESGSNYKLLLAGPQFWGLGPIQQAINEHNLHNEVVLTGRLANDELAMVLGSASALTFVPYYEGFGIPLVEAMEAGVPIVTANVTSLPEVAGPAALLVNPGDTNEIKNAMLQLYTRPELAQQLIEKGFRQKTKFSWDKTAELVWDSITKTLSA